MGLRSPGWLGIRGDKEPGLSSSVAAGFHNGEIASGGGLAGAAIGDIVASRVCAGPIMGEIIMSSCSGSASSGMPRVAGLGQDLTVAQASQNRAPPAVQHKHTSIIPSLQRLDACHMSITRFLDGEPERRNGTRFLRSPRRSISPPPRASVRLAHSSVRHFAEEKEVSSEGCANRWNLPLKRTM